MTRATTRWMTTGAAIALAMTARAEAQDSPDAGTPTSAAQNADADAGVGAAEPGGRAAGTAQAGEGSGTAEVQTPAEAHAALETALTAPAIRHLPPSSLQSDEAVLRFEVTHPELMGTIVVHARRRGSRDERELVAQRSGDGFEVRLPDDLRQPPAIEYWVVERRANRTEAPVFASARAPHRVAIRDPESAADARRALGDHGGHLSRIGVSGEYVDFGNRQVRGVTAHDRYYRLEASYAYAILSNVEEVRITVGIVRGSGPMHGDPLTDDIGSNYGGGSITWRALPIVRFETSLLFGYSKIGFEYGGGTSLIIGSPRATTFTVGFEGVRTLGWTGRVRLGWLVVPHVPMAASIEVSTYPAGEDAGVRLLQEIGYELYPGALVRVRAGYQGRTNVTGGPAVGGDLVLAF